MMLQCGNSAFCTEKYAIFSLTYLWSIIQVNINEKRENLFGVEVEEDIGHAE